MLRWKMRKTHTLPDSTGNLLSSVSWITSKFGIEISGMCGHVAEGVKIWPSRASLDSNHHQNWYIRRTLSHLYECTSRILSWLTTLSRGSDMLKISFWLPSLRGPGLALSQIVIVKTSIWKLEEKDLLQDLLFIIDNLIFRE